MSRADELRNDLDEVLSEFSTAEKKLHEIRKQVERAKVVSLTVDTYESLPFPVVRHIFYGLNEQQARHFMASHKESDKFFRQCFKGQSGDIQCANTYPVVRQVTLAQILAAGRPQQKKGVKQRKNQLGRMVRGTGGEKGTGV
jgi:hypothetical protein